MKTLSKSSHIPLYQQVVEWIRESIYSGELVEDDRIPSEFQIMDMLEVSRGTVNLSAKVFLCKCRVKELS